MPQTPMLQAALSYARSGFAVFPVPRGTKMSFKSAARNGGVRWGATRDPLEIERDFERWPTANIGIPTGKENKFWVMELDTAAHGVDGAATLARLVEKFGELPATLQALSPSRSLHFYFCYPIDGAIIRNDTSKRLGSGIDVRGEGGMVVVPPSERDDGKYQWINQEKMAVAPLWLLARVSKREIERPLLEDDNKVVHIGLVAAAVAAIPNENLDWESWNRVAMAIFIATGGSDAGYGLFNEWSGKSAKHHANYTYKKWHQVLQRSPPTNIGYGTLSHLATAANSEWLNELDKKLIAERKRADDFYI
jgi:hypothetical protein